MQYGFALPNFRGALSWREDLAALVRAAEALGYDSVWVADHIVLPAEIRSYYPFHPDGQFKLPPDDDWLECITTLAYFAGLTNRVRLGTAVMVPALRHPLVNAKMLATLDVLSGGRVILGIGAGWMAEEFALLGWDPEVFARRGAVTEEHVRIYRTVWRDERPSFSGKWWQFDHAYVRPRPVQPGGPPVWVGGHSAAAFRRIARVGDGWIAVWPGEPEELSRDIGALRHTCEEHGRDPRELTLCLRLGLRFREEPMGQRRRNAIIGRPEDMRRELDAVARLGIGYVVGDAWGLGRDDTLRTMERFACEVAQL